MLHPIASARAIMSAAKQSGIRLSLLHTVYARGGLRDEPLSDRQQRFGSASLESVERHMDALCASQGREKSNTQAPRGRHSQAAWCSDHSTRQPSSVKGLTALEGLGDNI